MCGYNRLAQPPEDFYTCPSCGTEFGYHDASETYEGRVQQWKRLRRRWLGRGAPWFSPVTPQPLHWDPYRQVVEAKLVMSFGTHGTSQYLTSTLLTSVPVA